MDDLKLGIIGAGGRGKLAKWAHRPGRGSRLVALCDTDAEALAERKAAYGAELPPGSDDIFVTADYRELLARELDAVFVCTPDFLHEEHAVAALEAGVYVYLEKPMAITIAGCDRILAASRGGGGRGRLMVGHNMRHMNIIRKMKALIDADEVGEVQGVWCRHFISYGGDAYFRDWHADRTKSTGLLLQKGAHDLDLIHWFAGAYTKRVSAFGRLGVYDRPSRLEAGEPGDTKWHKEHWPPLEQKGFHPTIDVEDQSVVNLELENGILATYQQCHFSPDACRNYTVLGTKGRLENFGDRPDSPIMVWNRRTDNYNLIGDRVFRGEAVQSASGHGGADEIIVQDFLDFVRGGEPAGAPPEAARMAVAAGCSATESLREGGVPVEVPGISA